MIICQKILAFYYVSIFKKIMIISKHIDNLVYKYIFKFEDTIKFFYLTILGMFAEFRVNFWP